jgi:hypothetical protein
MRANIERRRWVESWSLASLMPAFGECPLRADSVEKLLFR